jgi:hypothetical protein
MFPTLPPDELSFLLDKDTDIDLLLKYLIEQNVKPRASFLSIRYMVYVLLYIAYKNESNLSNIIKSLPTAILGLLLEAYTYLENSDTDKFKGKINLIQKSIEAQFNLRIEKLTHNTKEPYYFIDHEIPGTSILLKNPKFKMFHDFLKGKTFKDLLNLPDITLLTSDSFPHTKILLHERVLQLPMKDIVKLLGLKNSCASNLSVQVTFSLFANKQFMLNLTVDCVAVYDSGKLLASSRGEDCFLVNFNNEVKKAIEAKFKPAQIHIVHYWGDFDEFLLRATKKALTL